MWMAWALSLQEIKLGSSELEGHAVVQELPKELSSWFPEVQLNKTKHKFKNPEVSGYWGSEG